jgi:hypothetical protein
MSETTSFLGGAALAGLAAVILLKGGLSATSPTVGAPQYAPMQPLPTVSPGVMVPQSPVPSGDYEKQKVEADQLKSQIEQQRLQIEQLKAQAQSQQAFIDSLTAQSKSGTGPLAARSQQPGGGGFDTSNPVMSGLMWALGGMILTFGGGIALVGMFVLFAKNQRSPSRTIEVFHDEYPAYLSTRRRQPALPPRRVIKRVEQDLD